MTLWLIGGAAAIAAIWFAYRWGRQGAVKRHQQEMRQARGELVQRINELFAFQELSFMLAGSITVEPVAEQVTRYVTRFVRSDGTLIALATGSPRPLRVAHATGLLADLAGCDFEEAEAGMIGDAMEHGHVEVAHADEETTPTLLAGREFEIVTVAPLSAHNATVGALAVVKNTKDPFSAEDLRLMATVATHAAVALQNARFFELVKASKDQWEATLDALSSGVAVLDDTNHIRRANRALAAMVGESVKSVIGQDLSSALLGEGDALATLLETVRTGDAGQPRRAQSKLGRRTLRISASDMPGAGAGWVVVLVEDVTEREAIEAQLIQHEKLAAVGQLVSGLAHELNNPITSIAGLSEFLLEQLGEAGRHGEPLALIHEQAIRAGRIVHDLLAFARKGPAEVTPTDVNDIVQRTAALIQHEFKLRNVDLQLDLAAELPEVLGDRYQLQQVVLNLLANAIDAAGASPSEDNWVRVRTSADRASVLIEVSDSGPGITEEVGAQMFTPFFTTKEPDKGTGLGLSITYRIVEGHGGQLEWQCGEHGGALFGISLPRGDRADRRGAAAQAHLAAGQRRS